MIRKDHLSPYFKVASEAQGLVETLFSVTNFKDRQADLLLPGSFAKALTGKKPTVVFSHSWNDISQVLGKVVDWAEYLPGDSRLPRDLYGAGYGAAWARVKFNLRTEAGRTAFELVKSGDLSEWSWAFDIDDNGFEFDKATDARMIKSVREIYELTLCVIGANQLTQTLSAKNSQAVSPVADAVRLAKALPIGAKLPFISDATARTAAMATMLGREDALEETVYAALNVAVRDNEPDFSELLTATERGAALRRKSSTGMVRD